MSNIFKNKSILITGGSGSFGSTFVSIILKKYKPRKVIIYSRDELKHYELENSLNKKNLIKNNNIRFFIGDIRDKARLQLATKDVDLLIHAAALKHVSTSEYNPFEAVKTNILGAQNIIEVSLENNIKKVISLSTDKASSPINLYGATKLTSDKLFTSANNYSGKKDVKFSVVRYGNVMSSSGSVIPLFLQQAKTGTLTITDERMTRFNITLQEAVDFVIKIYETMWGGEIFIPKLPSYNILDLAKAVSPNSKIKIIGIRPGEKLHEEMISVNDSINTLEYKDYFVILPESKYLQWNKNDYKKRSKSKSNFCPSNFSYSSEKNKKFLKISDLKKLINLK